jgi:serine/threonine-protein kinase HipA
VDAVALGTRSSLMTRLEVRYERGDASDVVGHLLVANREIYFQYAPSFRVCGIELSPFNLPTRMQEPTIERQRVFAGLFGVFNDSLPDGWGMLLMDRALRSKGRDLTHITPLDRLAWVGADGIGALSYHPAIDEAPAPQRCDLSTLAAQARRVLKGSPEDVLPALTRGGGPPMGARPKVLAGVSPDGRTIVVGPSQLPAGYRPWVIKFASERDPSDIGPIEQAYALMARAAGVTMPTTRIFASAGGGGYFGVERFDRDSRDPARRLHVHTFAGLMHLDHRLPTQDYRDLLAVTRALTGRHADVREGFRRMVFNVLSHNRDDHTKNFSFLLGADGQWGLSPAYDLVFSHGPGGEHSLTVAGVGAAPTRTDAMRVAASAGLESREAQDVIEEVAEAVAAWPMYARSSEVGKKSSRQIHRQLRHVASIFGAARHRAGVRTRTAPPS